MGCEHLNIVFLATFAAVSYCSGFGDQDRAASGFVLSLAHEYRPTVEFGKEIPQVIA
jgi:hypothetical protein